jgi:uncharacterized protein
MMKSAFEGATLRRENLQPAPIPREWVIAGEPLARSLEVAHSPDGTCFAAHWDCTAGTFHWFFGVEETVHILEGEVVVRDASGQELRMRTGDVAVMPANAWMVWRVDEYVRKLAHCRYPVPRQFGRALRRFQTLRNRFELRHVPPPAALPGAAA